MSTLSLIKDENTNTPAVLIIYGGGGLGKSTLASEFPDAVFIPVESPRVKVKSFPKPQTLKEVTGYLQDLLKEGHQFKTLVIDSLDALETLVIRHVCEEHKKENVEDFGYGKGFSYALDEHKKLIKIMDALRNRGMGIVLLAHSQTKTYNDPMENVAYERHSIKLNEKASALYSEFADAVLFMTQKVYIKTDNNKTKAYGEGERLLVTEQRPSHLAKNRFNLPYEIMMPKGTGYKNLSEAMGAPPEQKSENMMNSIHSMLSQLKGEIRSKAETNVNAALNDPEKLMAVHRRLVELTRPNHQ